MIKNHFLWAISLASGEKQYTKKNGPLKINVPRNLCYFIQKIYDIDQFMIYSTHLDTYAMHTRLWYKKWFMCIITAYLSRFFCKIHNNIKCCAKRVCVYGNWSFVRSSVRPSIRMYVKIHHHHIISSINFSAIWDSSIFINYTFAHARAHARIRHKQTCTKVHILWMLNGTFNALWPQNKIHTMCWCCYWLKTMVRLPCTKKQKNSWYIVYWQPQKYLQ